MIVECGWTLSNSCKIGNKIITIKNNNNLSMSKNFLLFNIIDKYKQLFKFKVYVVFDDVKPIKKTVIKRYCQIIIL